MSFMEKQMWPEVNLFTWLLYESSFFHLTKFSHQSIRVNYFLSCLTLCDWCARLTWLLIKVAGKVIITSDILSMLCLLSSVFHNIPLQSSHRQEWSLHKHIRFCSIQVSSSLRIVHLTVVDKSINCFYIKKNHRDWIFIELVPIELLLHILK